MKTTTHFECIDYIPPQVDSLFINCQDVLCQSGEAPDLNEGWKFDF